MTTLPACWTSVVEQPVLDRRQLHLGAADGDVAAHEIDLELADLEGGGILVRGAGGVAQRHAHARQQLAGAERLGHVVVGAGVERGDLVALLAARRQHDDRHRAPLAQPPDDLQAVHVGQAEVEDHDVGLARATSTSASAPCRASKSR